MSLPATTASTNPLDSFDRAERHAALLRHAATAPPPVVPGTDAPVNMHLHTFFSFNAAGFSPTHIAVQVRDWGLYAAATCDFDMLDAADEFLDAAAVLGLRGASHIESRVYAPQFAEMETNSPGEPGICYVMGAGFCRTPAAGSGSLPMAEELRRRAAGRNAAVVERINASLPEIAISYDSEVAALTPCGSPTERHIVRAYVNRSRQAFPEVGARARFWGYVLQQPKEAIAALSRGRLEEQVRRRLIKHGGVGVPAAGTRFISRNRRLLRLGARRGSHTHGGLARRHQRRRTRSPVLAGSTAGARGGGRKRGARAGNGSRTSAAADEGSGAAGASDGRRHRDECRWPTPTTTTWTARSWRRTETAFVAGAEVFVGHTIAGPLRRHSPYCGAAAVTPSIPTGARSATQFFAAVGQLATAGPQPPTAEADRHGSDGGHGMHRPRCTSAAHRADG